MLQNNSNSFSIKTIIIDHFINRSKNFLYINLKPEYMNQNLNIKKMIFILIDFNLDI